jgi:hypothetical protein
MRWKTISRIGTVNMKDFSLNLKDICKILNECHKLGVSEFTFNNMNFKFHPRRNEDVAHPGQGAQELHTPYVVSPEAKTELAQFDQAAQEDAEEMLLMIDDPITYETIQMDRFLEKARLNGSAQSRTVEPGISRSGTS